MLPIPGSRGLTGCGHRPATARTIANEAMSGGAQRHASALPQEEPARSANVSCDALLPRLFVIGSRQHVFVDDTGCTSSWPCESACQGSTGVPLGKSA